MAKKIKSNLDRRAVINKILEKRGDALIVTGLGSSCYDVGAAGDNPLNFYLWGAMGSAAMIGLGLALAQPKRQVIVITGDGEMLMGLGALATIGSQAPRNLSIVVIDNELYSETGMQPTHTARGVDLPAMAKAAQFPRTATIANEAQLKTWVPKLSAPQGAAFVSIKVNSARYPLSTKLRDGAYIKARFREALLGTASYD